jgi:ppGpp synthetase/RelA/SpoT-type nucleotidyltranferase
MTEVSPDEWGNRYRARRATYESMTTRLRSLIADLVGLRIITYYHEDVVRIGEILKGEFKIDEKNSIDKIAGLAPDRFGYLS